MGVVEPTLLGREVKGWSPVLCLAHGLAPLGSEWERARMKVRLAQLTRAMRKDGWCFWPSSSSQKHHPLVPGRWSTEPSALDAGGCDRVDEGSLEGDEQHE